MTDSRHTIRARYHRGLSTSVVNNSSAFGFSITITATSGMLSHFKGSPTAFEIVLLALSAVLGISIIEAVVSGGFRRRPDLHPTEVIMLGTAANLLSVAVSLGVVYVVARTLPAPYAWAIAPLVAAAVYVLVEGLELAIAEDVQEQVLHDYDAESQE